MKLFLVSSVCLVVSGFFSSSSVVFVLTLLVDVISFLLFLNTNPLHLRIFGGVPWYLHLK